MIYTVGYEGERLDRIAKIIFGSELDGAVEALLDANPGLARLAYPAGHVPEGTEILVPEFEPVLDAGDGVVLAWE